MRLVLALLLLGAALSGAQAAELVVTVDGMRSTKGDIRLSIYDSAAQWPDNAPPGRGGVEKVRGPTVVFRFDLPPGVYAINGFHDENGTGKFETNFLGLPEEGYFFSNNVHPFLSAPSFASASFRLPPEGAAITIHVIY